MANPGGSPIPFIGSGVKQDLQLLYSKFSAQNSIRLRDFAEVFRELGFETILHFRINPNEFTEFAEYLLQNAALFFGKENEISAKRSYIERVFGIYACYALYSLQPADHVCQIPVTVLQLKELIEFQQILADARALEPIAALKQLFLKKAFRVMILQSAYDPATHRRYLSEEELPDFGRAPIEPFAGVKAVEMHKTIGEIMCIHNAYVEAKQRLGLTDIGQTVEKMNPADEIKKHIEKHQKAFEESGSEPAFEKPKLPESAGTSRASLRSQAYSAKMKHTRQRRHLDPNMEENFKHLTFGQIAQECINESLAEPSASSAKPKPKRKRPIKTEKMPLNEEEQAEEVLRAEYASRVKPEIEEPDDGAFGGKIGKQGTSGVAKIRAPPKRKQGKLVVVKTERKDSPGPAPNASQINNSFNNSPEKKKIKTSTKPPISREWSTKLHAWSGQLNATDKELKKLTSSIKIEPVEEDP